MEGNNDFEHCSRDKKCTFLCSLFFGGPGSEGVVERWEPCICLERGMMRCLGLSNLKVEGVNSFRIWQFFLNFRHIYSIRWLYMHNIHYHIVIHLWIALPETKVAPENGWLECSFPVGMAYFPVAMSVSGVYRMIDNWKSFKISYRPSYIFEIGRATRLELQRRQSKMWDANSFDGKSIIPLWKLVSMIFHYTARTLEAGGIMGAGHF